jgi:hypothetical protein
MNTSLLVAKERQPDSPFGLGQKHAKNQKIRRKCATVAPYSMLYRFLCNALQRARQKSQKIRRKCATVASYSMLYRFLCNALQRARQNPKNTAQMRHSCTISLFVIADGFEMLFFHFFWSKEECKQCSTSGSYKCYRLRIVFIICYNSTTYLKEAP